jgi:hypothetical protein
MWRLIKFLQTKILYSYNYWLQSRQAISIKIEPFFLIYTMEKENYVDDSLTDSPLRFM